MKLRHDVLKIDVGAALQVLNFAIFPKELTDMEDREQRETEKQQDAGAGGDNVYGPGGASGGNDVHGSFDRSRCSNTTTVISRCKAF
ncbi:DNA replication licensing factor MCM3 homolog 3-like [Hordeum vulgare subsp. vulgare]|uniref:DNA replication licensing factor MCM3 homolog 3-like n=1 Tax=Hordeum vulgare subsp. vulgare TaxID=112509 RepID=UPI001D1A4439|nr:DNA replication licensing factor MCM3 homolog 3-like [Hordeum vulgare subsp. vulgare]